MAALVAALLLGACGTVSATQAVKNWIRNANYTANYATVNGDIQSSLHALAVAQDSVTTLHTVCGVLATDLGAAYASLPTPDSQSTTELGAAYETLSDGAQDCYEAAGNAKERTKALDALHIGAAALFFANQRLQIAAGQ